MQMIPASPGSRLFKATLLALSALLCIVLYTGLVHQEIVPDHFSIASKLPPLSGLPKLPKLKPSLFSPSQDKGIPKKIWYKLGPKGKNDDIREWTGSCIEQNPGWEHEFKTDESGDEYVVEKFSESRPDIVEVYLNLTIPILKADLLRYLLLYVDGGIWSDLDVSCEGIPMDDWIPEEFREKAGLVVGWEFDWGLGEQYIHEFASWTIMSKPGLPHMMMVINDIIESVYTAQVTHKLKTINELTPPMVGDIVDFTGPRRMTRSIMKSLETTLKRPIARTEYEYLRDPVMLDDVLILPGYAFSSLANDFSNIGGPPGPVLVTHHYAGSWKNEHGGETAKRSPVLRRSLDEYT
ncbi:unnamed protein product [Discula destructiva]